MSQIRVSQGFPNTVFALLRLFRKICKVSQIRVSQGSHSDFRKNSQIGFSFRKFRKVFAMGSLLMIIVLIRWDGLEQWVLRLGRCYGDGVFENVNVKTRSKLTEIFCLHLDHI